MERLEMYLMSGINLHQALTIVSESSPSKQRKALEKVRHAVETGKILSSALSLEIQVPSVIRGLISHGEASGRLAESLAAARSLLERQDELRKKCASALAYPVIIGIFALLLTFGLVRGVMPQIIPLLKGLHVQLPFLTRAVIWISDAIALYGWQGTSVITISGGAALVFYKKLRFFKQGTHALFLRIPIAGKLIRDYELSVFLRSWGGLVESGLPVAEAFAKTSLTISLLPVRTFFLKKAEEIATGSSVARIFVDPGLPIHIGPLLVAGEASGFLGQAMIRSASILERDIEHSLKRLTALIEPLMMAGMGVAVGAIALSIMMPIYDISKALQR